MATHAHIVEQNINEMPYNEETRAMLRAYQRETDAQIYALQQKIYELQSRVFDLEMQRYLETHKFEDHGQPHH